MTRQLVTAKTETDGELGGTMTRNNGGWMPPSLLLLKLKTRPTETSEGFLQGLHCVCRVFLQECIDTDIHRDTLSRHYTQLVSFQTFGGFVSHPVFF